MWGKATQCDCFGDTCTQKSVKYGETFSLITLVGLISGRSNKKIEYIILKKNDWVCKRLPLNKH